MPDTFARLASDNDLEDRVGRSLEGLTERYLYSSDMVFRYAFGRWWGDTELGTTAIWVLLNPATGDTEQRHRPTLERCISRSRAAGHTGLVIVNLFALRNTDPRNLRTARDPIGPLTTRYFVSSRQRVRRQSPRGADLADSTDALHKSVPCWAHPCASAQLETGNLVTRFMLPRTPHWSCGCRRV